ncbi:MAG: hypothetical protein IJ710_04725 [Prevotella sp.]|nr:hypothetical protein [Prevotella sp.]
MANIKHLEMAAAIAANENIEMKKTLFGLKQTAVYKPTQSTVAADIYEYAPADGERMERLLRLPLDQLTDELRRNGRPMPTPVGHVRLEWVRSQDGCFVGLQLFRFVDFKYNAISAPLFYEGEDAQIVAGLLAD